MSAPSLCLSRLAFAWPDLAFIFALGLLFVAFCFWPFVFYLLCLTFGFWPFVFGLFFFTFCFYLLFLAFFS